MYRIIDLSTGAVAASEPDRPRTLFAYLRLCNRTSARWLLNQRTLDFDFLNITGKDTVLRWERAGYEWNPVLGHSIPVSKPVYYLRRYQVLDSDGRPVDIRLWKDEIKAINAGEFPKPIYKPEHLPRYRIDPCEVGHKYHLHRSNCKAMLFQQLKLQDAALHEDESDFQPIIDKSKPRKRITKYELWNSYDDKANAKYNSSKCWKDQTKSPRQWAKHKSGMARRDPRRPKFTPKSIEDIASSCNIVANTVNLHIEEAISA